MKQRMIVQEMSSDIMSQFLCVCALAFFLASAALAAPARPQIQVPYLDSTKNPIVIDGSQSDWTVASLAHGINFFKGDGHPATSSIYGTSVLGTMTDRADGETTVYLTHDGEWLYLLAIIHDNLLEQRTSEHNHNEAWREDCLHIYIDSTNAARANIPNPPIGNQIGYEQFGVSTDLNCYTENCDFTTNNVSGAGAGMGAQPDQTNWKVAVSIDGTGPYTYTIEERIPLREVAGHNLRTMEPGQSYGFNAEFCDSDAGAYLQGWIFWSSDGSTDCWNSENMWGVMALDPIASNHTGTDWMLYK